MNRTIFKKSPWRRALSSLQSTLAEGQELTSVSELIQDLIAGTLRRSTFTQRELELLLDLQTCRVRKASRSETLRRYLRAVHLQCARNPGSALLRFSDFLGWESARRNSPDDTDPRAIEPALTPGLSSR